MNGRSLLAAYLRAQRDLGVEEFIFEHGSKVKQLFNKADSAAVGARYKTASERTGGERGYLSVSDNVGSQTYSSSSKLSKLKTIDYFDKIKPAAPSGGKAGAPVRSERREKLAALYREAASCSMCQLSRSRSKVVFGAGSADGKLFIIGECPSDPQDESAGLPFQGEAGELYARILDKMGLDKNKDVFAAYLQKCRSAESGGFDKECAAVCKSRLDRQIEIIEPAALLVFGQPAANVLLNNEDGIERLRGANHTYKNKPVVVTYSLSLMNKEPQLRTGAWEDMKRVLGLLRELC